MCASALELQGISANYRANLSHKNPEKLHHLSDLSLTVHRGDLVVVLGPNGAGKTTLLRVLSGALRPTAGDALLFGHPLQGLTPRDIAREVAVVAQTQEVAFGFVVREVVMMGRAPHQGAWMRPSAVDRDIVAQALERCDLAHLAERPAHQLSGGEQKRVAIARALAQRPKVMLLDEPSAFLDIRHEIELYDLLADEVTRAQLACVVVMHDLNVAAQYASQVLLLKHGRAVALGPVEAVMTYALLRETFDADLYVGVNDLTGARFFLPMRGRVTGWRAPGV